MSAFDRRRTPARRDLAAAHLSGTVEAMDFVEGWRMHVVDEIVGLTERPGQDCSLDTQALFGEEAMIYEIEEGWAWGQLLRDSYVGYMPANALAYGGLAATHAVRVPRTFLYPVRNMKAPVTSGLTLGARLAIAEIDGDFARTQDDHFVWAAHLAPVETHAKDFVATAEAFLGVPYLWGGKSSLGLDCSGLVQLSLQAAGRSAPRDTDMQQAELGTALAPDATLQRGDLVFWKGHVGIMQDATRLLHANGHHMQVASEPFDEARRRIAEKSFGAVTSIRRL